ncbi:DUF3344 domain-containing protein [Methanosarcina sp. KYL-1]|uniref:DUF3344 domain-containing protein n=1 Tax=Methanosarcina sp. KYL-1 TaxID=2602068 RepID=UPI002101AB6D|nr:DUF3344 domain-containing protein [Methanosarcina sp. KYL-1]
MIPIFLCLLAGLFCLLAFPAQAEETVVNGYTADRPLTLYTHESVRGGLAFTAGSSYYSEKLYPGDTYTVSHRVNLPEGASVKTARLYNYWSWSAEGTTGRYPELSLRFEDEEIEPGTEYSDRKGWGSYDYPSGTWAYDVSEYIDGSRVYSTCIENKGPGTSYFCIDGVGLLIIYTDPNGKDLEYWISEGADLLNSQLDKNGNPEFGAAPSMTICEMMKPSLSLPIRSATLWTVTRAGNWEDNTLWINNASFPGICAGRPYPDLEIDTTDITDYLRDGENSIRFQAVGDFVLPSNAILAVEINPGAVKSPEPSEETLESSETAGNHETEAKEAPGFGVQWAFSLLLVSWALAGKGRNS